MPLRTANTATRTGSPPRNPHHGSPADSASTATPISRPTSPAHIGTALLLLATCLRTSFDPCTAQQPHEASSSSSTDQQVPPFAGAGDSGYTDPRPGMFSNDGFMHPHITSAYSLLQEVSSNSGSTSPAARRSRASSRTSQTGSLGGVGTADASAEDTPQTRRAYAAYGDSSASSDDVFANFGQSDDEELLDDADRKKRRQQQQQQQRQGKTVTIAGCTTTTTPAALAAMPKEERAALLAATMEFLPLDQIELLRAVSDDFDAAASRIVAKPLSDVQDVVFVRWTPPQLRDVQSAAAVPAVAPATTEAGTSAVRRAKKALAAAAMSAPTVPYHWRCLACASLNNGNKACACCGTQTSVGACRVFLGQLRKELTAELATAMAASLCPDVRILHMESHTNGTGTRGKGCAWAYVDGIEDARRLMRSMHKRAFVDVDAEGGEGFWYVMGDVNEERKVQLAAFAQERAAASAAVDAPMDSISFEDGQRSAATMPRQPVVAEAGAQSLLAFALAQ